MSETPFDFSQARGHAARWALWVGLWWIASFALTMLSLSHTSLGIWQWVCAIASLVTLIRGVNSYTAQVTECGFLRRWWLAWTTSLYAALLTTMAQYLYFRFLDKGHMMTALREMFENEEVKEAMAQQFPQIDFGAQMEMMSSISLGEMTATMLMTNLMVALVMGLLGALLTRGGKRQKTKE